MVQQINLYTPILLKPKLHFSAKAMAQALAVLAVSLGCFCGWVTWQTRAREHTYQENRQWLSNEQQQLDQALSTAHGRNDPAQLERELARVQADTLVLHQQLAATEGTYLRPGQSHSAVLALMARTVPGPAWITRLQVAPSQLEINGLTLDPNALQGWIRRLSAEPLLAGQPLAQVRVEKLANAPGSGATGLQATSSLDAATSALAPLGGSADSPLRSEPLPNGGPGWAFRLNASHNPAQAGAAATGAQP
ncbi:MAG TPA: PilN domain-containing protein [Ideonella sp.]|uniref:PilN domain-containing protein n=1 Tax=Ideonella sp. TaxID=1929293 RepID=UPI002C67F8D3|nr:PilN domain-containing protein [Ideonella sp.]HSI50524.1 PilN domain-containing protein [Ideonella sp.]